MAAVATALTMTSCDDFTDTVPKGKVIPQTTEDYRGMLIDISNSSVAYPLANVCSDDVQSNQMNGIDAASKAYFWMEDFYKENEPDPAWNTTYKQMYIMNVIVQKMMNSTGGTDAEKRALLAEAKVWRAYYNWYLQSLYAPVYNAATAATDLSVPLVQTPDLEAKLKRATVKEITDAIWTDLEGAEELLPEKADNNYRPDRYAVHALKARILFYQGEYDRAAAEATEALKGGNTLNDMRTWSFKDEKKPFSGINNRPLNYYQSPETIWYQSDGFNSMISTFSMSDDLRAGYQSNDLRLKFWFTPVDRRGEPWGDDSMHYLWNTDYSLTVPEMMLIRAEALARKKDPAALDILNELRRTRFTEDGFKPLTAADGSSLLDIVLGERRRELPYSGLRWLDMKRLSSEGLYTTTVVRELNGVEYRLEPNSKLYVFPIPLQVRSLNNAITSNDRKI